jgi:hypothetical protein
VVLEQIVSGEPVGEFQSVHVSHRATCSACPWTDDGGEGLVYRVNEHAKTHPGHDL